MATKKKAKKAGKKSTARARKAAPARKAAKKRAVAAKAPKRTVRAAARKPAKATKVKAKAKPKARAKVKVRARAKAVAKPPIQRRDRPGHIDPKYARELRTHSEPPEPDPESFFGGPRASDDLSEEMGEEVVATATTGEYEAEEVREQDVPEEVGGPFVETTAREEFGHGTDPSNPKGASREPFPRT
ncbi:MAG TPA: hypothetical protein VF765_37910 [Polyangiaceae bacterium]